MPCDPPLNRSDLAAVHELRDHLHGARLCRNLRDIIPPRDVLDRELQLLLQARLPHRVHDALRVLLRHRHVRQVGLLRRRLLRDRVEIAGGERGVSLTDMLDSIRQEYKEHEDLPNTTNPDDWAKISGKKGERIVYVRTLITKDDEDARGGRAIERMATGQYL